MKKYLKNKNFIPNEFIEKIGINENKKNNKLILILLMLNIIVIPTSANRVLHNKENVEVNNNNLDDNINTEKGFKKEDIKELINNILPNILSMNIQNNNGSIKVKGKEDVFIIEEKGIIKIKSIIKDEQNDFTLEVSI
ncbi:hypothetical protein NSA50_01550 [Clostridium sp. DSM 100503]|uniref:hypothetical protein n=1 Tax=Clostridium sp. DSM 100503 TaxID=2963282 RepID=UPI00214A5392|nr:hypothetical protein [Clostridium sp. DSM 100503]MCR1949740.1 hypothetical protein [Clostridium sp. DSM 100503]